MSRDDKAAVCLDEARNMVDPLRALVKADTVDAGRASNNQEIRPARDNNGSSVGHDGVDGRHVRSLLLQCAPDLTRSPVKGMSSPKDQA
jgi:hypothetical protein